ncbi:hypothetical protein [Methanocorpusculum bavaricum]|uniref:hypothetical protein n=1 Tax=Methanocorpusculum bavaricum TaxID=71518 RepID=UPI00138ADFD0|nr:hypothetical protein [Methanocorpusculum bavaricum]
MVVYTRYDSRNGRSVPDTGVIRAVLFVAFTSIVKPTDRSYTGVYAPMIPFTEIITSTIITTDNASRRNVPSTGLTPLSVILSMNHCRPAWIN